MSFIPFTTVWVDSYPTSWAPLAVYFADMALASITFHLMCYLIIKQSGQKFGLGLRSIVSLITYSLAACLGGFCPIVAFIIVAVVSCWWIFPEKQKSIKF